MQKSNLNESNKGDRTTMANLIAALVVKQGAKFEWASAEDGCGPREISLNVTAPGGLQVRVEFDGDSPQPNVYVLSWHIAFDSPRKLNVDTFGGDVNSCHFKKATYVARGFDDLCAQLTKGLSLAKSGEAFISTSDKLAA